MDPTGDTQAEPEVVSGADLLAPPRPGDHIHDTWTLSRLVGKGGFGLVFTARHDALGREDALKFLHPHLADDPEIRTRFEQEAVVMARLRGEHLVYVHDYGEHRGLPFFVMERLEGRTLRERLTDEPVSLADFYRIAEGILRGVAEIHAHGIVHRDVKPDNIFVLEGSGRIKMLDFGLAMTSMRLTTKGAIMGTPLYMAPELLSSSEVEASVSTDIYSVGMVLYQLLTGRVSIEPSKGSSLTGLLQQLLAAEPEPPSTYRPGIPEALDDLVLRAIDKEPARRPETAKALLDGLEQARSETPSASASALGSTTARGRSRSRLAPGTITGRWRPRTVVAMVSLLLLVAIAVPGLWWPWAPPPAFSDDAGLVVTAPMWASDEITDRYRMLCDALRAQDERRVRCARISRWNDEPGRYRAWFSQSGASMAIHVGGTQEARLLVDDELSALPLFDVLPPLALDDPQASEFLAPLLVLLPHASSPGPLAVPMLDIDRVGYRWATVAALLRRSHARDVTRETAAELRELARCEGARDDVPLDRRLCDVAQYLLASLELENPETCARIAPTLRRLAADTLPELAALSRMTLAGCVAAERPAEAAELALAALETLSRTSPCALVTTVPLVPFLGPDSEAEVELARRIASFDPQGCAGAADAFAQCAAGYRVQGRYALAAADLYSAYRLQPGNRRYLAAWAEALLHTSIDAASRDLLLAELRHDLFADPVPPEELQLASTLMYLRWLVTREPADARAVLARYASATEGQPALLEGACSGLRLLACDDPEGECSLDLLQQPKAATLQPRLARALGLERHVERDAP